MKNLPAEHATTPDDPRLSAYEAGRWYALNDRSLPAGATRDCARGYADASGDGCCIAHSAAVTCTGCEPRP